mgnify:CR=1 FL=1
MGIILSNNVADPVTPTGEPMTINIVNVELTDSSIPVYGIPTTASTIENITE